MTTRKKKPEAKPAATEAEKPQLDMRKARRMAQRVIEHHFGTKPARLEQQTGGLSNFVFLARHAEGDFIVRLVSEAGKINDYIKEQWAVNAARKVGVPAVEILEVGNEVIPHPYMIAQRVAGAREATHHPERRAILREMGRYAALINSIPTDGFGGVFDWSHNQLSRNATWEEFLANELKLDVRLEILSKQKMLTREQLKTLRAALENAAPAKRCQPHLNHGDMRLKNVLADESGKVCAIIDWEDCVSNLAPQWELSLALHDLTIDEKQDFLEGYGIPPKEFAALAPVVKAINIINYAPVINHQAEAGDEAGLDRQRQRLGGTLDLYSL